MMEMYKLVDKIPVPCTLEEWGRLIEALQGFWV